MSQRSCVPYDDAHGTTPLHDAHHDRVRVVGSIRSIHGCDFYFYYSSVTSFLASATPYAFFSYTFMSLPAAVWYVWNRVHLRQG